MTTRAQSIIATASSSFSLHQHTAPARLILFALAIAKVNFLTRADESAFAGATADKRVIFRRPIQILSVSIFFFVLVLEIALELSPSAGTAYGQLVDTDYQCIAIQSQHSLARAAIARQQSIMLLLILFARIPDRGQDNFALNSQQ